MAQPRPAAAGFTVALNGLATAGHEVPAICDVFGLTKTMIEMPLGEVRLFLGSDEHFHRVGAVSVTDFRARRSGATDDQERASQFALHLGEHDRLNAWDLVDRAAPTSSVATARLRSNLHRHGRAARAIRTGRQTEA